MNFLFLVEGEATEIQVYRSWLKHTFPNIDFVIRPEDMTNGNSCRIVSGRGFPNLVKKPGMTSGYTRLKACLKDIKDYQNVDYFFICLDSEDESYQKRLSIVKSHLYPLINEIGLGGFCNIFIIVQYCCFETWLLGNTDIASGLPTGKSHNFKNFMSFFDIMNRDPEAMPDGSSKRKKAKYHMNYLTSYLKECELKYKKKKPGEVCSKAYLDALRKRCNETGHLPSLKILFDTWDFIKGNH
ncbi:hypothetical protein Pse7367_2375 [Thalassoporum mexicanum PCC 7367]|uniref:hypothetical protein n=1 Tax=Thalassoporum mexicanum TaxID=3457544 RepID=UPI00029FE891|nr:hypothetical protein [Pseudanabaena sp. PCC 7367]AFY70636.1 hypothetical protein Pse7367_2375 [Pseudanabaena sp. PCC 7367]